MYQLQYWNQSDAQWRQAGFRSEDQLKVARKMRDDRIACGDCVRFRIIEELLVTADTVPF
jgi:hypothetical protein